MATPTEWTLPVDPVVPWVAYRMVTATTEGPAPLVKTQMPTPTEWADLAVAEVLEVAYQTTTPTAWADPPVGPQVPRVAH